MPTPTLVLASSSPYRQALLRQLGLTFVTAVPNVDESLRSGESADALVARLASAKANAVSRQFPDALIIGSDQVAVLDEVVLGKPGTHENAVAQLTRCSGRSVRFATGLCLLNSRTGREQVDVVDYEVEFRKLSSQNIENYVRREQPYNCAGSFKSEGLGAALFVRHRGPDPSSLIGLPLFRLVDFLHEENYPVL